MDPWQLSFVFHQLIASLPQMSNQILIGCAAGFAGDRFDAGEPLVAAMAKDGRPAYLMYETLGERTLALAQQRQRSGAPGYLPDLESFVAPVLRACVGEGIPIIGNFGAADPVGGARRIQQLCVELGVKGVRVAAVLGDDLLQTMTAEEVAQLVADAEQPIDPAKIVAANVYLGAQGIADALAAGANVVVTGRVADPSLALGPMLHAFGWALDDWERLAAGTMAGHLLECGTQVTGGYFMDPGFKDVLGAAELGYPYVEIGADGGLVLTKPAGTGGQVSERTVREQLLYEIHDPAAYLTPDVVLDLSSVATHDDGVDRIRLTGSHGKPRPPTLKATVCYDGGWIGESEISYAGPNAEARARLAIEILQSRLTPLEGIRTHFDLIGVCSLFNDARGSRLQQTTGNNVRDVRVRLAASGPEQTAVRLALREVEALYTTGPAGGGGVRSSISPLLASASAYIPRDAVSASVSFAGEA
jgi:hypothetical protein